MGKGTPKIDPNVSLAIAALKAALLVLLLDWHSRTSLNFVFLKSGFSHEEGDVHTCQLQMIETPRSLSMQKQLS